MTALFKAMLCALLMLSSCTSYSGEISPIRHFTGAALSILPGFGIGHTVQRRWRERGWYFTFGEITCFLIATGSGGNAIGGAGFVGFKIWEVVDAIHGPSQSNRGTETFQSINESIALPRVSIMPVPFAFIDDKLKIRRNLGIGIVWTI